MKKTIFILTIILLLTGCFKRDRMEDIDVIITNYPIEYVTNRLYKDNSKIESIYPRSTTIDSYTFTKKQMKDFSNKDLFIYDGNSKERELATNLLEYNKNLKIIDASYGVDTTYAKKEVWLNPSNILMIAQNIRNELTEYISNPYLIKEVEEKYDLLKVDITELETEYKKVHDNSYLPTIVTLNETWKFLEKYGYEVISIYENNKLKENQLEKAKNLFKNNKVSYFFRNENQTIPDQIKTVLKEYDIETLTLRTLETITEKDIDNNDDYLSLMYENIELLKKETYK